MKILVSPGFGSGWSTWAGNAAFAALTWQPLIEFIESGGDRQELNEDHPAIAGLLELHPHEVYVGGNVFGLRVVDIPAGTRFRINDYDGSESIDYGHGFITAT